MIKICEIEDSLLAFSLGAYGYSWEGDLAHLGGCLGEADDYWGTRPFLISFCDQMDAHRQRSDDDKRPEDSAKVFNRLIMRR